MSGVRLVGALGRDQTYVSAGNPTHRKGSGMREGGREGLVPGAGVGSGGNRARFQENSEDISGAGVLGEVGAEALALLRWVKGRTHGELILQVVEALKTLLGQRVGTQVVDLIQEHILPPPQAAPPSSPSELDCVQQITVFRRRWRGLARQGLRWLRRRMTCRFCSRI